MNILKQIDPTCIIFLICLSYNFKNGYFLLVGANNLIPIEIAFKIASKIRANERFTAYIVIPMWPEGNPTGAPTQRILFWQVISFNTK